MLLTGRGLVEVPPLLLLAPLAPLAAEPGQEALQRGGEPRRARGGGAERAGGGAGAQPDARVGPLPDLVGAGRQPRVVERPI